MTPGLTDRFTTRGWRALLPEEAILLAERLAALAPDALDKVILPNTDSESNEIGMRLGRDWPPTAYHPRSWGKEACA